MREVDLIVHGVDWLITMDSDRRIYRDGALALAGDTIVEVGKSDAIMQRYQAKRLLPGHRTIVVPGLVDGHRQLPSGANGEGHPYIIPCRIWSIRRREPRPVQSL